MIIRADKETSPNLTTITPEVFRIDAANASRVKEAVLELLDSGARFILDLTYVGFIDTAGLAVITTIASKLEGWHQGLVIVVPDSSVHELLSIVRIEQVARVTKSLADARQLHQADVNRLQTYFQKMARREPASGVAPLVSGVSHR